MRIRGIVIDSRVRWRCRRGTRELDIALQNFLDSEYQGLSPGLKGKFDELLETPDPVLMDWIYGRETPADQELINFVEWIRKAASNPTKIR